MAHAASSLSDAGDVLELKKSSERRAVQHLSQQCRDRRAPAVIQSHESRRLQLSATCDAMIVRCHPWMDGWQQGKCEHEKNRAVKESTKSTEPPRVDVHACEDQEIEESEPPPARSVHEESQDQRQTAAAGNKRADEERKAHA